MAEVKWIKTMCDMYNDEKIVLIESMPDADAILVIWSKLLLLCGRCCMGGYLIMPEVKIPYTDEMLASVFHRSLTTVRMALDVFERFGMISIEDSAYFVTNFNKYQSLESIEDRREKDRIRQARHRAKAKDDADMLPEQMEFDESTETMDVPPPKKEPVPYQEIVDMYHATCTDLPSIRSITDPRKRAIAARYKEYGMDGLKELFERTSESDFLSGRTDDWKATFDWLMKPANFVKVIEGNYMNRGKSSGTAASDDDRRYGIGLVYKTLAGGKIMPYASLEPAARAAIDRASYEAWCERLRDSRTYDDFVARPVYYKGLLGGGQDG